MCTSTTATFTPRRNLTGTHSYLTCRLETMQLPTTLHVQHIQSPQIIKQLITFIINAHNCSFHTLQLQILQERTPEKPKPKDKNEKPTIMSCISASNLPPWEVLNLVAHHLDPKTLAIASCVSKSWFISMSSDHLWQPICSAYYPSLSNLKLTDPSVPYRRLFSVGYAATKRRLKPPPPPIISLDSLVFAIDVRTEDGPHFTLAKPAKEFCADVSGLFRFDMNQNCFNFGLIELQEDVKITWNVVLRGWEGVFTMMDFEGRLSFSPAASEGWYTEELPSPRCCSSEVASGIVADLKLGFCSNGHEQVRVEKVSVGMLSFVNWRYVNLDDGLRYLQHFLLPTT